MHDALYTMHDPRIKRYTNKKIKTAGGYPIFDTKQHESSSNLAAVLTVKKKRKLSNHDKAVLTTIAKLN